VGVPPIPAPNPQLLSQAHQVGGQGEGRVQDSGQQGSVQAVGPPQEQARHELRDDGTSPEVLLPTRHLGQGGRPEAGLSVCGRAQDRGHRGGGLQQCLRHSSASL